MNESNEDWITETADACDDDEDTFYHPPSPTYSSDSNTSPSRWSSDDSVEHDDPHDQQQSPDVAVGPSTPDTEPRPRSIIGTVDRSHHHKWQEAVDFDSLLISVENKLKAPFSSLDFSKLFHSSSLNLTIPFVKGSSSQQREYERIVRESSSSSWLSAAYISLLTHILHRMTKPIQLQLLVAIIGIDHQRHQQQPLHQQDDDDDDQLIDVAIQGLSERAQRVDMDEWVRVLAGTIQGLVYHNDNNNKTSSTNSTMATWGHETQSLWNKAMDQIISKIQETVRDANQKKTVVKNEIDQRNDTCPPLHGGGDICPFYIPFHYSLLPQSLVESCLPDLLKDTSRNASPDTQFINIHHFTINTKANVLTYDDTLEQTKAAEEKEETEAHQKQRQQNQLLYKTNNKNGINKEESSSTNSIPSLVKPTTTSSSTSTTINTGPMKPSIIGQRSNVGGMNDNIKRRGIAAGTSLGGGMAMARSRQVGGIVTISDTPKLAHDATMAPKNIPMKSTFTASSSSSSSLPQPSSSSSTIPSKNDEEYQQRMNERKRKILETAAAAGLRKKT